MNKDKCMQLLQSGIEQKREGNYNKALEYYEMAKSYDPSNYNVYYNPAKLLLGLGRYDEALKHFLAYSHILILTNIYRDPIEDSFRQQIIDNLREVIRSITTHFELPPAWLAKIVADPQFIKPIVDINCNRYVGICLSANSKEFNSRNEITEAHVLEIRNGVLGKSQTGVKLNEEQELLLIAIGLYFTWKNIDLTITDLGRLSVLYFHTSFAFVPRID